MRRLAAVIALVPALSMLLGTAPAHAHIQFQIFGFQYFYVNDGEPNVAGYVAAGPVRHEVNDGPSYPRDDFETVTNRDAVPHTFTQCLANCEATQPTYATGEGDGFHFRLPALASAEITEVLDTPGTYVFGCTIHPFMRGVLTVEDPSA